MASPGNPHQAIGGGNPLDMTKFFIPGNVPSTSNLSNFVTSSSPFSPPLQPPPLSAGIYSFANPQHVVFNHHEFPTNNSPEQQSQRSASFPTPPGPPLHPAPNHGARLMALLSSPPSSTLELPYQTMDIPIPSNTDIPEFPYPLLPPMHSPASAHPPHVQLSSNKKPKGRRLSGDHLEYDIDFMLDGEEPPQLKVTPITRYGSDPQLVVGRQIAVNKTYICYGLKLGNIRILNINTATRSLLRGHVQRVTDMALFAEDVHLLASVGTDGRVCIWKIYERPDVEEKDKIKGAVIFAMRIVGEKETVHPRVCWHHHKQEVLMVGFGKRVLRIDTNKVGREEPQSTENPVQCPVDKLCDGVTLVGKHDGEVTELSMCQWMVTRLVSASMDGTVKIWEDKRVEPLTVLKPHDGRPVYSATFLTSPDRPDHTVMITAGPLNRELKLWVSSGDEGGLLTSESDEWSCTQTLEVKSSASSNEDDSFFNQLVGLSRSGLVVLANAKRNAIYAVHLDYGPCPSSSRLDYISEFTVTLPILSFIGTSDVALSHTVKLYCVQTQAIQQYALDLSLCLPPGPSAVPPPGPPSPPDAVDSPQENTEKSVSPTASSAAADDAFKPPTHLVTPSEILMTSSPSADDSVAGEEFTPPPPQPPPLPPPESPSTGDVLSRLLAAQQDLPGLVAAAVSEEGKRMEAVVGKHVEMCVRANADSTWARLQEELARHERMVRERTQNVANTLANFVNRDFPAALDKAVRNVGPSVSKSVVSGLEKTVAESVQRAVGQLEKSVGARLDAAVARQVQSQFQTAAKQALQDAVRSGFEASVVPAFEVSCKAMFDQVDAAFHKGMSEHASAAQLQLESSHTPLAVMLRDAIASANTMTQTLSAELVEGQRKLLALASSGPSAGSSAVVDGSAVAAVREVGAAPVMELPRLLVERKYEEAFTAALHRSDVAVVSWLCYQVDLPGILSMVPLPLSQGVLLSLVQQLACDVGNDTARKVGWMTDVVVAINPEDPTIALHVQQIFGQVLRILTHYGSLPTTPSHDVWSLRVIIKMVKSMLLSCK